MYYKLRGINNIAGVTAGYATARGPICLCARASVSVCLSQNK